MRLHIVARGKIGRSPEADLVERYGKRIGRDWQLTELPEKGGRVPAAANPHIIIALDEKGANWSSEELAKKFGKWQMDGVGEVRFLIGAADGLTREERDSADYLLAFGKATWPHLMVRAMLAEQIYRATTILANHPYHRAG